MSLFRKIFGSANDDSKEDKNMETSPFLPDKEIPVDEMFTYNFRKNGGIFLYCDNLPYVHDLFLNFLE